MIMIDYIKQVFQKENYFLENNINKNVLFYWKMWEYFLISKYNKEEIINFFESKKTNDLIDIFDDKKKNSQDVSKNTSLIILLKVDDLKNDFEGLKNQIMKIEEDEYFFRKYIIIYDDIWEIEINAIDISKIDNEVKNINLEKFRKDPFWDPKAYLLIELFIKLPFLKVIGKKIDESKIWNLMNNINIKIWKQNLSTVNDYILEEEKLENKIEEFENKILDIEDKDVDSFLIDLINLTEWK